MNALEIIILRGIPGSGKSTLAEAYVKRGYKRINKDELRQMINGYDPSFVDEDLIHSLQQNILRILIKRGHNIIIDNTHTKQKYVNDLVRFIQTTQGESGRDYLIGVDTLFPPLEVCKKRNASRERRVPDEVLERMYEQLKGSFTKRYDTFYAAGWQHPTN